MLHRRTGAIIGFSVFCFALTICSLGARRPIRPFEEDRYARKGAALLRPPWRRQPILAEQMPDLLRRAPFDSVRQGPVPDKQLTPTAQTSQEFDVATPALDKVARVAFVSNGVDEWVNEFEPDPSGPPPDPADPNNVPDGKIDRWGLSDDGFNIWLMRHDGTQQLQLSDLSADERDPAYDPGGTTIAFVNNQTGTYQVYTIDVLTRTIRQITTDPGNKSSPTWSADGTQIAYATDINGAANRDIVRVMTSGVGIPVPLAATPADEYQPHWGPRGLRILYTRADAGATHIWLMDASGAGQEQLTNGGGNPTANDQDPAWRQDGFGMQFAFASDRLSDITDSVPEFNIWTVGSSGEIVGGAATVHSNLDPTDLRDDIMPAYSPALPRAPTRIFFTSYRMDAIGPPDGTAEPDIWAFILFDYRPPTLDDFPSVSNRNPSPGSDIIVRCQPYDDESGVQSVFAWFKDPDTADDDAMGAEHKLFTEIAPGVYPTESYEGGSCPGPYLEERGCDRVGSTELFDDGDMINNGDEVAGDGVFSGIWTTPPIPTDIIIDIELTDNVGNFVNFDDVYGLTTVTFTPTANVLFVDDYCEGQGWLDFSGITNDRDFGYPKESYFTRNESEGGPGVDYNTFAGTYGEQYDLWRIICRGAPDLNTLTYYTPTSETQYTPDLTGLRQVPVANRCVFWAAPHTGSVWAVPGSLVRAETQRLLRSFVERGGRLCVAGMDVAWGLTMNGQLPNDFLTEVLGAQFVADDAHPHCRAFEVEGAPGSGGKPNPVADDTWSGAIHWTDDTMLDVGLDITHFHTTPGDTDGSHWSDYPDVIQATGSQVVYEYSTDTRAGGGTAAVRREDPQSLARVVYFAFPFEAINRRYITNQACLCRNKRSKLMHMTLCYLRTGGVQGRVLGAPGLKPIRDPEPMVTLHDGPNIVYAQRCQEDGTFVIGGVTPEFYNIQATRPGYKIDKPNSIAIHGGLAYPRQDFVITEAQPGAIGGEVTSLATGAPIANVTVTAVSATDPLGLVMPPVRTAADGAYIIPEVPVGDYDVTADGSTATPPYGSDSALVTVIPGGTVTQDFQLPAANGLLEVTVTSAQTGAPLEGATVDARLNNTVVGSGSTDDTGLTTLDMPPGDYEVLADMPGFAQATKNATVLSAQTVAIEIQMTPLPPGSIAGQIYRATTPDQPLGGVQVRVVVGGTIVQQVTSQDTWTYPGGSNPRYNYFVPDVPAGGRVEVRAVRTGFTVSPDQRTVAVSSGVVTYNVNFTVSALHTFPAGLQLVSVPFDYSDQNPSFVLGTPAGQTLKMAVWDPSLARYAVYPTAPADRLRLGVGFWLNLPQAQDLVSEGRRAGSPFYIPLGMGWNGIGNPFTRSIDFFSLKVRDSAGVVRTMREAISAQLMRSGLWVYQYGGYGTRDTLVPYSGYWVEARQAVTLIAENPDASAEVASAAASETPPLPKPKDGWLAPIVVWSGGMSDQSTAFGIAPGADEEFDAPKPPVPPLGPHVYCAFAGANGVPQAVDVRGGGDQTWTLDIHTTAVRAPVTVTWPDLTQLPPTARPILHDTVTGQRLYMRTTREYTYRPKGKADRRLEIAVTDAPQGLLAVTAATAPHGNGATIIYTLARDAQVTIEVRNIAGRAIAQPIAAKPAPAGRNTAVWNGQQHDGLLAPAGMYTVRVVARSDDGQETSALAILTLRR